MNATLDLTFAPWLDQLGLWTSNRRPEAVFP
jgi:hypothetical protein